MDWHPLDSLSLEPATRRLLEDVRGGLEEVNRLRPLHPQLVETVTADLLADRVYNSNAVEGNPLDLRETRRILEAGHQQTTEKRSRSEQEVLNLGAAVAFFEQELVPSESPHQIARLLDLHAVLMRGIDEDAGRLRHKKVMLRGAKYQPPDPSRIEDLLEQAFRELATHGEGTDPVVAAAWIHWAIARTHPFFDGNGRTARLWQDLVLLRAHATCAIIRPEDRTRYYAALQSADEGRFDPLVLLLAERVAWTIDRIRFAAMARERMKDWAQELTREVGAPDTAALHIEYIQWSRRLHSLMEAIRECARAVNEISPELTAHVIHREIPHEEAWKALRWKQVPTDPRVCSLVVFLLGLGPEQFDLHIENWLDEPNEEADTRIGACAILGITMNGQATPVEHESDGDRRLLELLVSSGGVHMREVATGGKVCLEKNVSPLDAAQRVIAFMVDACRSKRDD